MDRRNFLKKAGVLSGGVMLSSSAPAFLKNSSKAKKPNVVFVVVDQMRGDALSCLGSPNARTPNLDNMAREGVIFENAFSNSPVCLPSRNTIFTGLYPHQHGTLTNKGPYRKTVDGTLIQLFKENGYKLGYVGKNHMMQVDKATCDKYFDYYKFIDREDFRAYSKYTTPFWHCDTHEPSEKCFTTTHTNEGIDFINGTDDPFFLFLSYHDPHPPYMAPSEYSSKFSSDDMVIPDYVPASKLSRRLHDLYKALKFDEIKDSDITETMRYYYASISYIDDNVGRIINSLERKGILDNTIVIFTSDHADFMGEHRMVRKEMFLYDAILHVPMIWYCPGLIRNRFRVRNIAQSVDFMPTIGDFINGEIPSSLPGRSLKPILQGQCGADEEHFAFASALYYDLPDYVTGKGEMPERIKNMPLN
ncbi:sulfatase-like hydrolase/transferase, partial [bacterium]|nr:sulfatase-like hydrolase/transferase [bacterium]